MLFSEFRWVKLNAHQSWGIHLFGFGQVNIIRMFTLARRTNDQIKTTPFLSSTSSTGSTQQLTIAAYRIINSKCNYLCMSVCLFSCWLCSKWKTTRKKNEWTHTRVFAGKTMWKWIIIATHSTEWLYGRKLSAVSCMCRWQHKSKQSKSPAWLETGLTFQ